MQSGRIENMAKSEWRLQCERAVLSLPDGKRILAKVNKLLKKEQIAFFKAFDQHGVGIVTAYEKVTGRLP
jgi:hypothetical protein